MRWSPPFDRRLQPFHLACILILVCLLVPAGTEGLLAADIADPDIGLRPIPLYEIFIPEDAMEPVLFRVHLPSGMQSNHFFFTNPVGQGPGSGQLMAITAVDDSDRSLPLHLVGQGFTVDGEGYPARVDYEIALHPSVAKPDTWPNNDPRSLRWDDYVFITSNALVRWSDSPPQEAHVAFHIPGNWTVYTSQGGETDVETDWIHVSDLDTTAFLLGPDLFALSGDDSVRLFRAGALPWDEGELLSSLERMLVPLRNRDLIPADATYDFIVARYPGALRLNPFINSRILDEGTFIQWVGIGSADWWRKHTAADIVSLRKNATLRLAPEARWFERGLVDYGGLLLLYEAGLLDEAGLYQSLRNMFATATHYSGPLWPSLVIAGLSEEQSHDAQRVLQFRAPAIAFLFDLELRERSGGRVNLLDWWALLAAREHGNDDDVLYNEDLLPPVQAFGDMGPFARQYLFLSADLRVNFDDVFDRWVTQTDR